jgi:glutathione S-transferase
MSAHCSHPMCALLLPLCLQEFLKLHNTVPAGIYEGKELRESMPMAYWVDETFSTGNKLQPKSPEGVEEMKNKIKKFTSGQYDVTSTMYGYMFAAPESEDAPKLKARLLASYAELSKDLEASGGPFLLGSQFTLADIAVIPFIDRGLVVNGHYKGFSVPQTPEYAAFHAWRAAYSARPSHKISDADRLPRSMQVQPFAAQKRRDYLVEMYEGYAQNVREEARAMLRHAPPGVRTVDITKAKAQKAAKEAEKKASEQNNVAQARIIGLGIAALVGAAIIARIVGCSGSRVEAGGRSLRKHPPSPQGRMPAPVRLSVIANCCSSFNLHCKQNGLTSFDSISSSPR